MDYGAKHVFDLLLGSWSLRREVSGLATVAGSATIILIEHDRSLYHEAVRTCLHTGEVLEGTQRYFYRKAQAPAHGFAVFFSDERTPFHTLDFSMDQDGQLRAEAVHLCREDRYVSEYIFYGEDSFSVRHVVRGPHKDYTMQTSYEKERGEKARKQVNREVSSIIPGADDRT